MFCDQPVEIQLSLCLQSTRLLPSECFLAVPRIPPQSPGEVRPRSVLK